MVETPREEVVPPLNAPQPSELTTDKLLKQALANAPAPASSPPGKNKKKKPEPNVLSLMGECCYITPFNPEAVNRCIKTKDFVQLQTTTSTDNLK